jgi:predicted RNA-binding Zn ribbon-like protein
VSAMPAWAPDGEAKPAPMPLLLVQAFVNTWESDEGTDLLADDEDAALGWLREAGLLEPGSAGMDLAQARAVRESIRALLVHNGGGPAPTDAELAPLRAVAAGSRLAAVVDLGGRIDLRPESVDPPAALARLLLVIRDAQRDGTWGRLKACRNDECRWAFYDRTHAGHGAWCDMAVCGNRIKNRNLRSRRAGDART